MVSSLRDALEWHVEHAYTKNKAISYFLSHIL